MEEPPSVDVGLGTAYERLAIYRRICDWYRGRIRTAVEGPLDGFAGIRGLHLLPLARAGARVTVVSRDPRTLELVQKAYRHAGCIDALELHEGAELPGREFDLALDFNGLTQLDDWQPHLGELAAHARELVLFVTHPTSYGAFAARGLAYLKPRTSKRAQYEHPATRAKVLDAELERYGHVTRRAWVDCPWWPDLFVEAGTTLAGELRSAFRASTSRASPRFVYAAEEFPYGGEPPAELARTLARHPTFDDSRIAPLFAHHRMLGVCTRRRPESRG